MNAQPDDVAARHRRVLLAERDAARSARAVLDLRADLARLHLTLQERELEVAEYLRQIGRLEDQLAALFNSLSWRASAPLRRAVAAVGRLRLAVGGAPVAPLPGPPPARPPATAARPPLGLREDALLLRLQRDR